MSEWRGLHNPTWHHLEHSGMVSCDHCGASGCLEASPCRCCLHAEWGQAQASRAEVERLTGELADRDRRIEAALNLHDSQCCKLEPPCMEAAILLGQYTLRGES